MPSPLHSATWRSEDQPPASTATRPKSFGLIARVMRQLLRQCVAAVHGGTPSLDRAPARPSMAGRSPLHEVPPALRKRSRPPSRLPAQIGRASCRESVCQYVYISVVAVSLKKKTKKKNRT